MLKGADENVSPIYPLDHFSFSTVYWKLAGCKYRFFNSKLSEDAIKQEPTDAMIKGKAGHRLLELAFRMKAVGQLTKDILMLENMTFRYPLNSHMIPYIYDFVMASKLSGLAEKEIRWTFDGIAFISFADFIDGDIKNGEHAIIDWKFMKRNDPINAVNVMQLIFYHIGLKYADNADLRPLNKTQSIYKGNIVSFVERIKQQQLDIYPHEYEFSQADVDYVEKDLREQIEYFKVLRDSKMWPKERGRHCTSCGLFKQCNPFHVESE